MSFYQSMVRRLFFFICTIAVLLTACSDNDSFSTDSSHRLTFSKDTVRMDTLFSLVPSTTYSLWAYNNSGDGVRIRTVRLERGNQSGFRVNVDGTFLNPVATDFEVRKGDSIRVFIELTSHENQQETPQLVDDNLVFTLESGVEQKINLRAYSWDATKVTNKEVAADEVIESSKPLVVYGKGITVKEGATLTIKNTKLYFHDGAGIDVEKGAKLVVENVLLRGDRLDHMFDYLPYDRVSGQWRGVKVAAQAKGVEMTNCELRSAYTALWCDSTSVTLAQTIIHNNKGYGVYAHDSEVTLTDCLISNTLDDCLNLQGCKAVVDATTLAQFYPYSAARGAALRFAKTEQNLSLLCSNTIVTGYDDDVVFGEGFDGETVVLAFQNCLLRTDKVDDEEAFTDVIWEKKTDDVQGVKHFVKVDDVNFIYDFNLKEDSQLKEKEMGWEGLYRY